MLSLRDAIREGRLEEFIQQAEQDGLAPADRAEFERRLGRLVRAPQQEHQTSHSRAHGGSRGTQTR